MEGCGRPLFVVRYRRKSMDEDIEPGNVYKNKLVVDEEEYVNTLEKIIERDFFPEIPQLKRQAMWLDMMQEKNPEFMEKLADNMPRLNEFINKNISEDNASFSVLLEKDKKTHERKYNWAYDSTPTESALQLLTNGTRIGSEQRALIDSACAASEQIISDTRTNTLDTWSYTAQNTLMFPATGRRATASSSRKLLTNSRTGQPIRAPKEIQYQNSRFKHPISTEEEKEKPNRYQLVEMTPLIRAKSPVMTWGTIESSFEMTPMSKREEIAHALDARNQKRKQKPNVQKGTLTKRIKSATPSIFAAAPPRKKNINTDNLLHD